MIWEIIVYTAVIISFHIVVVLGELSGIENYDSMNLMMLFVLCNAILLMYYILKRLNWKIGLLSLPLALFIFMPNFIFGILWGRQPTMFTEVFLIALFWLIPLAEKKHSWILIGILIASLFLGHPPQVLFGVAYLFLYFIIKFLKEKKISKNTIIFLSLAIVLSLLISAFYINIFQNTINKVSPLKLGALTPDAPGNRFVFFSDFKLFSYVIILGLIISFLIKNKEALFPAIFMLFIGFTNYILDKRGIETRFMWPIFLSGLIGLAIYKFIPKKRKLSNIITIATTVIISILILNFYYTPQLTKGSIVNYDQWEALSYMNQNSPERSKILFFYGNPYDQLATTGQTKRLNYIIRSRTLIESINEDKI
jgi:hypothetical protein